MKDIKLCASKIFKGSYLDNIFLLDSNISYVLIYDKNLENYARCLLKTMQNRSMHCYPISLAVQEKFKTRKSKELIENKLIQKKITKDTCIIALGGGVLLDLVGFVAATYCRGVKLISIPTTLLAMVDAAIGGKVGVNAGSYKNWIGTFYPAHEIWIDDTFLKTLNEKEIKNGIAEIIKYALIYCPSLMKKLENIKKDSYLPIIQQCISIKQAIVGDDLLDQKKRNLLNFGHTICHALEGYFQYKISHGEAVALGIVFESYLSFLLGYLPWKEFQKIDSLVEAYSYPKDFLKRISLASLLKFLKMDKKNKNEKIYFVLLDKIGKAHQDKDQFSFPVDVAMIRKAYEYFQD
jgi:3-dehydroquinate synthase